MRFNGADWLRLILACTMASAALAVVSGASWAAVGFGGSVFIHRPAGSSNVEFAVSLALGLLYMTLTTGGCAIGREGLGGVGPR